MDQVDRTIRNATYGRFVELGRAPSLDEIAVALDAHEDEVAAGWRRLHDAHALVLHAGRDELRMVNPFSAVPTAYRVYAAERWWYGNCAWDAVGICAALHTNGRIRSSCPDCGDDIDLMITDGAASDERLLFHCLVPAASWWDDIVFT
jgi:hypothetical protein